MLSLSPSHVYRINMERPSYWSYMTLAALELYEEIYQDIVTMYPQGNGYVSCRLSLFSSFGLI